ncbi:formimidoylglutamate deiminase [Caulobacter sp. KR2-114]|uniref:formimidoylglutamate deiminase n=1 Tax=Caulobacter sp. KR2-114 TaxID=3400912 RepID=UPI003C046847
MTNSRIPGAARGSSSPIETLWFESALLPDGWAQSVRLTIADGLISRVETGVPQSGAPGYGPAIAGLANLHSHAFQRGMAGLAEARGAGDDSFWTWREVMYRFVERLDPEGLQAIAALAYLEMLESGFTRVGEFHYLHHDRDGRAYADPAEMAARIAAAAHETGIGLTLLPVFYAHGGFGGAAPGGAQRRFVNDVEAYGRLMAASRAAVAGLPDAVVGVAPHSLRAVTAEELASIVPMAQGGPVHIHIAEQTREVNDCLAATGTRPVTWLLDHAPVGPTWCLVHATHVKPAEAAGIVASGAVVGLCPVTEANLGDGVFPASDYLALGGAFGIGSDSNVSIDPAEELRTLEYAQRLALRRRNVLAGGAGRSTGGDLHPRALAGGGQALGGPASALHPGARADIVAFDGRHPCLVSRAGDAVLDSWIFSAGRGLVDGVWCGGRQVVSGGRHHRRDAIVARYGSALRAVLA